MRPLKLTMSSFGPYVSQQIDFQQLGRSGLYLITGETGAGKTTIFDAIRYALYGDLNGEYRSTSMIRSKYADESAPTEVELVFEYKGQRYTVRRNPEYERKKQRGEGTTKETAGAELILPDNSVVSGVKPVTRKVEEILGISGGQFSQIAMIAQGQFQKLIYAKSDERTGIFRSVFGTEIYSLFQKRINLMEKELRHDIQEKENERALYVRYVICREDSGYAEMVKTAKEYGITSENLADLLHKLIAEDTAEAESLSKLLGETEKRISDANVRSEQAKQRESIKKELVNIGKKRSDSAEKLSVLGKTVDEKAALLPDADDFDRQAIGLENSLSQYDELDRCRRERISIEKSINDNERMRLAAGKEREKLAVGITALREERKGLENSPAELERCKGALDRVVKEINDLTILERSARELGALKRKCDDLRSELEKERSESVRIASEKDSAEQHLNEMRGIFYLEQAGILARDRLKEGEPCPVCGSVHHPMIASLRDDAPSEQEIKQVERALKDISDRLAAQQDREKKASELYSQYSGQLETRKETVRDSLIAAGIDPKGSLEHIRNALAAKENEKAAIEKAVSEHTLRTKRRDELDALIPQTEKKEQQKAEEVVNAEKAAEKLKADHDNICARGEELSAQLTFDSKETASKEITLLKSRAGAIRSAHEEARKRFDETKNEISAADGQIDALRNRLSQGKDIDLTALDAELEALNKEKTRLTKAFSSTDHRIKTNTDIRENTAVLCEDTGRLEKRYAMINELSETANGKISGKKLDLETYVQTAFFDSILGKANVHLMSMSGGKYEMERREEADRANSSYGLEINAVDHYNGTKRDIRSLSGGESFLASLSLALGLSEEIQESAGGIQLDTMFVDEGFGSLDSDTLDRAMKALTGLTGGRLIGIISHVDAFKNEIDKQIIVTKQKSGGSSARIIL
ncbi:MAG: SMC family ATPase [Oscillospiraceae bacterium]|nr:SMC family ATPase [Oscillospiraceae bacterium]